MQYTMFPFPCAPQLALARCSKQIAGEGESFAAIILFQCFLSNKKNRNGFILPGKSSTTDIVIVSVFK